MNIFRLLNSFFISAVALSLSVGISYSNEHPCDVLPSSKVCYVKNANDKNCLRKPPGYNEYPVEVSFDTLFKISPEIVQIAFCTTEEIRVVSNFEAIDRLAYVRDNKIFFSRDYLFNLVTTGASDDFGFKVYNWPIILGELKYFFEDSDFMSEQIYAEELDGLSYKFAFTTIHELAHIIDFSPKFNAVSATGYFGCILSKQRLNLESYGKSPSKIKGYDVLFTDQFTEHEDSSLFRDLEASSYTSFYGLTSSYEDFAEIFASLILHEHFGVKYYILKDDDVIFDRSKQLKNSAMKRKINIVHHVFTLGKMSELERAQFDSDLYKCAGIFE